MKVNFNGALSTLSGNGGVGFVIRDFVGILLLAHNIPLVGVSVSLTEITRALAGLKCAIMELGAKKVWMEGDSRCVVYWINSRKGNGGYSEGLIRDMSGWT